ncbi:MAG: hypothetical protein ACE5LU_18925 [Anaerolineae bacterium]
MEVYLLEVYLLVAGAASRSLLCRLEGQTWPATRVTALSPRLYRPSRSVASILIDRR